MQFLRKFILFRSKMEIVTHGNSYQICGWLWLRLCVKKHLQQIQRTFNLLHPLPLTLGIQKTLPKSWNEKLKKAKLHYNQDYTTSKLKRKRETRNFYQEPFDPHIPGPDFMPVSCMDNWPLQTLLITFQSAQGGKHMGSQKGGTIPR